MDSESAFHATKRQRLDDHGHYRESSSVWGSPSDPFWNYSSANFVTDASTGTSAAVTGGPKPPGPVQHPCLAGFEQHTVTKQTTESQESRDAVVFALRPIIVPKDHEEVCFGMLTCDVCPLNASIRAQIKDHYARPSSSHLRLSIWPEPGSMDDIIRVNSETGDPIGTVSPEYKCILAQLLVQNLVRMQAVLSLPLGRVRKPGSSLEVYINLFGREVIGRDLGAYFSHCNVCLQHPVFPDAGHPYRNPHLFTRIHDSVITECTPYGGVPIQTSAAEAPEATNVAIEAVDLLGEIGDMGALKEVEGNWRLATTLLSHQKFALSFFSKREQGLSHTSLENLVGDSKSVKGGILADSMGLGKTLSIISLVLSTLDECRTRRAAANGRRNGPTLIIAPVTTLGNWEDQIATHVKPGHLKCLVYHSRTRSADLKLLCDQDIIITTFNIVTQEWKRDAGLAPLHEINWFRTVLDEAHEIRTLNTRRALAIHALRVERRWAVTGTPLQNDLKDFLSLFVYLQYSPIDTLQTFKEHFLSTKCGGGGVERLRTALNAICLRRKKNVIEGALPARTEKTITLSLRPEERAIYEENKIHRVNTYLSPNQSDTAEVFKQLLKLRMICDHGADMLWRTPSSRVGSLSPNSTTTCVKCQEPLIGSMEAEGAGCPHRSLCIFCADLLELDDQPDECPECSFKGPTAPGKGNRNTKYPNYQQPSTKVYALLEAIKSDHMSTQAAGVEPHKHVVFSVWTRMLDLIGLAFEHADIEHCRLDGTMPRTQRDDTLREFRENSHKSVILISLMAGGVGINLTCASRVHLMEPHWNPMIELQALERVHRLGQRRDVEIRRYIIRDSFEMDILRLQKRKTELASESLKNCDVEFSMRNTKKEIIKELYEGCCRAPTA